MIIMPLPTVNNLQSCTMLSFNDSRFGIVRSLGENGFSLPWRVWLLLCDGHIYLESSIATTSMIYLGIFLN